MGNNVLFWFGVFGFSRGTAAASHCSNRVRNGGKAKVSVCRNTSGCLNMEPLSQYYLQGLTIFR